MPTLQTVKNKSLKKIQKLKQRFALVQKRPELPLKSRVNLYEQYHIALAELEECLQSKIIFMETHKVKLVEMTRLDPDETTQDVARPIGYLENGMLVTERPIFKYPDVTMSMYKLSKAFKKQLSHLDNIVSKLELTCFDIECETQMSLSTSSSSSSSTSSVSFISFFQGHLFGFDNSTRYFEERILYQDSSMLVYYGNEGTTHSLNGMVEKNGHQVVCTSLAYAAAKSKMTNFLSHLMSQDSILSSELIDQREYERQQPEQSASHYYFAPKDSFGEALYTLCCLLTSEQDIVCILNSYNHAMAFSLMLTPNKQIQMTFFDPNENTTKEAIFLDGEAIKQFTFKHVLTKQQICEYHLNDWPFSLVILQKVAGLPEVVDKLTIEKHKIHLYLSYNRHELLDELLIARGHQLNQEDFLYINGEFSHAYVAMLHHNQASDLLINTILSSSIMSEQDKIDIVTAKNNKGEAFLSLMMMIGEVEDINYYLNKILLSHLTADSKLTLLKAKDESNMTALANALLYAEPEAIKCYLSYLPQFQLTAEQTFDMLLEAVKSSCVAAIDMISVRENTEDNFFSQLPDESEMLTKTKICVALITDSLLTLVTKIEIKPFIDALFEFEQSLLFPLYIRSAVERLIEVLQEPARASYRARLTRTSLSFDASANSVSTHPFSIFSGSDSEIEFDPIISFPCSDDVVNAVNEFEFPPEPDSEEDVSTPSMRGR